MDTKALNTPLVSSIPQSTAVAKESSQADQVGGQNQRLGASAAGGDLATFMRVGDVPASQKDTAGQDALGRLAHGTAERLQRAAATVRERSQRMAPGAVGQKVAETTADAMDQTATLVDATSAKSIRDSVLSQMRKHPWVSLGLGLTAGIWLGRALRR